MLLGQLRALNISVSRERVRRTIRRIDPLNTALRWGGNLSSRRPYSVPGPNSLWHIGMYIICMLIVVVFLGWHGYKFARCGICSRSYRQRHSKNPLLIEVVSCIHL